jgi:hypothetical protein
MKLPVCLYALILLVFVDCACASVRCGLCVCSDNLRRVQCSSKQLMTTPTLPDGVFVHARSINLRDNTINEITPTYLRRFNSLVSLDVSDQQHHHCVNVPLISFPKLTVRGYICPETKNGSSDIIPIPIPLPIGLGVCV